MEWRRVRRPSGSTKRFRRSEVSSGKVEIEGEVESGVGVGVDARAGVGVEVKTGVGAR